MLLFPHPSTDMLKLPDNYLDGQHRLHYTYQHNTTRANRCMPVLARSIKVYGQSYIITNSEGIIPQISREEIVQKKKKKKPNSNNLQFYVVLRLSCHRTWPWTSACIPRFFAPHSSNGAGKRAHVDDTTETRVRH